MAQKQLLQYNSRFGDYEIVTRISLHYESEREVDRVKSCKTRELTAITVFHLGSKRYKWDSMAHKKVLDFRLIMCLSSLIRMKTLLKSN